MSAVAPELTTETTRTDDDDVETHWARRDDIVRSSVTGEPVTALCGKTWVPSRDPSQYPECPRCAAIKLQLTKGRLGAN